MTPIVRLTSSLLSHFPHSQSHIVSFILVSSNLSLVIYIYHVSVVRVPHLENGHTGLVIKELVKEFFFYLSPTSLSFTSLSYKLS